jgi:hypothetical protein
VLCGVSSKKSANALGPVYSSRQVKFMTRPKFKCLLTSAQAVEIDPVIVDVARRFMSLSNPVGTTASCS